MSEVKTTLRVLGTGLIAGFIVRKVLVSLGIVKDSAETAATAIVNADFKNDIGRSYNAWDQLNRQLFTKWNLDHITHYIILQGIASSYPRAGVYTWLTNFFATKLIDANESDITDAVNYINNNIYCQMEVSAVMRNVSNSYPNFDMNYVVNQTWWTKWLDPTNTTLLPLFASIHNLPVMFPDSFNYSDMTALKSQVSKILNNRSKVNY